MPVWKQERRAKSLWKRNGENLNRALAALQKESVKEHPSAPATIRLSLEVPDVASAQRRLGHARIILALGQELKPTCRGVVQAPPRERPPVSA